MAKKNKRNDSYLSIRKKLIAAVAMLLVASFMVASSSYAWFTLSTAPEVTGIQTTVGANGSLEIALRTTADGKIAESTTTDGAQAIMDKNKTWGNLVDLSDSSYGLTNIVLKPASLHFAPDGVSLSSNMLAVPQYGSDGRIVKLDHETTISGAYDGDAFKFGTYGVRAVGTTSTATQQQLDFTNAKSTATISLNSASSKAGNSVYQYGPDLAQVLAAKAADGTEYDLSKAQNIVNDLRDANAFLETAIRAYYKAAMAAALKDIPENAYKSVKSTIGLDTISLETLVETGVTYQIPSDLATQLPANTPTALAPAAEGSAIKGTYTMWKENNEAIADAQDAIDAVGTAGKDITKLAWSDVTAILIDSGLVKIEDATLNGYKPADVKANISNITSSILNDGGIIINLGPDSGVYANIASATIDYGTTITFKDGTSVKMGDNELELGGQNARMNVTGVNPKYNVVNNTADVTTLWATTFIAKEADSAGATITDAYAYMIDLAFRTNAADSKLQLQTDATGRIYGDDKSSEATMGHGATMSFDSYDLSKFTVDQVKSLMDAVRIVFVDGYNILAIGALDTAAADVAGSQVTAKIRLVDYSIDAGKVTIATTQTTTGEGESAVTTTSYTWKEDATLMSLTKNATHNLSVLVYLDGEKVTNEDVAADNATSMNGILNLQFSSNAELKPMEYANLMKADGTSDEQETPAASTNIQLANTGLVADANVAQSMTTAQTLVLPAKSVTDKDITWGKTSGDNAELADGKLSATAATTVVLSYSYAGEAEGPAVTGTVTVTVTAAATGGEGS